MTQIPETPAPALPFPPNEQALTWNPVWLRGPSPGASAEWTPGPHPRAGPAGEPGGIRPGASHKWTEAERVLGKPTPGPG